MGKTISWNVANHMMGIAAFIYCLLCDEEPLSKKFKNSRATCFSVIAIQKILPM